MYTLNNSQNIYEVLQEISNNVVCATSKVSDQPAQSEQNLCWSLKYSRSVKQQTEHHLEFLSLKETAQAHLSLYLSKCHIDGNHVLRLIWTCEFGTYHIFVQCRLN